MRTCVRRLFLMILAVFLITGTAAAEMDEPKNAGWYAGVHLGAVITSDVLDETSVFLNLSDTFYSLSTDPGFGGGAAIGYKFQFGLRLDADVTYRLNTLDKLTRNGIPESLDGEIFSLAYMLNCWYEFNVGAGWMPYLGLGLGAATKWVDLGDSEYFFLVDQEDDSTSFAFQFGLGVAYALTNKMVASVDYRYFDSLEPDLLGQDFDYANHNIMAGFRFHF